VITSKKWLGLAKYCGFNFLVSLATDFTKLPSFDYEVALNDVSANYSQNIRMNYISAGMTYYFSTWEVFGGRFMKRNF